MWERMLAIIGEKAANGKYQILSVARMKGCRRLSLRRCFILLLLFFFSFFFLSFPIASLTAFNERGDDDDTMTRIYYTTITF